ncbi:hypothetical protein HDZ31DRAFT_70089 [Schizophyllum fasciatum]
MFAAVSRAATLSTTALQRSNDAEASSPSVALPEVDALRDMRAYEHARQRTKRAEEIARRKALKERSAHGGAHPQSTTTTGGKSRATLPSTHDDNTPDPCLAPRYDDWDRISAPTIGLSRTALKMEDVGAKPAKSRKNRRKDVEYEMISPLPPVIALDDANYRDVTIDEPWEYIPRPDEVPKASYAAVLRT